MNLYVWTGVLTDWYRVPIIIKLLKNGDYTITDGVRRLAAARYLKRTHIEATEPTAFYKYGGN
jgi:hypothetical protein